jgi:hypothetical protein
MITKRITKHSNSLFDFSIKFLLIWIVFQDLILSLIYKSTRSVSFTKYCLYTKDVLFVLLVIFSFVKCCFSPKNRKNNKVLFFALYFAFIAIFAFASLINHVSTIGNILIYVRSWTIMPGFLLIGYSVQDKKGFKRFFYNYNMKFLLFVAIVGIVDVLLDWSIGTKSIWQNVIQIGDYMADVKDQSGRLIENLPGNFYGYSADGGFTRKRLVSIWGGPLTSGYALLIPCILSFVYAQKKKRIKFWIKFAIFYISILLTYTRIIIILCSLALFIYYIYIRKSRFALFVIAVPLVIIIGIVLKDKISSFFIDGSTIGHLDSVIYSFSKISFWGSGLGTFEFESTFLTCAGQTGFWGMAFYLIIWFKLYKKLKQNRNLKECTSTTIFICCICYFFTGFISLQLTAYTTICPFYLFSGFVIGNSEKRFSAYQFKKASPYFIR